MAFYRGDSIHLFPILKMKNFLKTLVLFFVPCIVMVLVYVVDDPFRLYWSDENLYEQGSRKCCSNDAVRGIRWMNKYGDTMLYDSFILGSSRSDFYYVEDWKQYLSPNASCFHFNQSGDNLLGTLQRVRYLYKRFEKINNILIIMDGEYLVDMNPHKGPLFREPWQVTDEWDFLAFNAEFFCAFYSIDYQKQMWKESNPENELDYFYIPQYNELHKTGAEEALISNAEEYFARLPRDYQLYDRDEIEQLERPVIGEPQIAALNELHNIFQNEGTDYRIIISPLYNQKKLNPVDLEFLENLFGKEKVFDFSGKNAFTNNMDNYYECSHYRPQLCRQLLKICYD